MTPVGSLPRKSATLLSDEVQVALAVTSFVVLSELVTIAWSCTFDPTVVVSVKGTQASDCGTAAVTITASGALVAPSSMVLPATRFVEPTVSPLNEPLLLMVPTAVADELQLT